MAPELVFHRDGKSLHRLEIRGLKGRDPSVAAPAMPSWKVWPSPPRGARTVWLELVVRDLRGLPLCGVLDVGGSRAEVLVQWVGSERKSGVFRRREIERSCTARQPVWFDGAVSWQEGFHRQCKLKMADSQRFRSWIVDLEIHVSSQHPFSTSSGSPSKIGLESPGFWVDLERLYFVPREDPSGYIKIRVR